VHACSDLKIIPTLADPIINPTAAWFLKSVFRLQVARLLSYDRWSFDQSDWHLYCVQSMTLHSWWSYHSTDVAPTICDPTSIFCRSFLRNEYGSLWSFIKHYHTIFYCRTMLLDISSLVLKVSMHMSYCTICMNAQSSLCYIRSTCSSLF